ncbi:hypothetical protein CVS40_8716 [Lucilia cuprina]|nr:hypothetical protein CVS40_8716 [Lucilia cuprina]
MFCIHLMNEMDRYALFVMASEKDKLDPSDAAYVDVIHTECNGSRPNRTLCHDRFYMNDPFACSHQEQQHTSWNL